MGIEQYTNRIDLKLNQRAEFPVISDVLREQRGIFYHENLAYYSQKDFMIALSHYEQLVEERYWIELMNFEIKEMALKLRYHGRKNK